MNQAPGKESPSSARSSTFLGVSPKSHPWASVVFALICGWSLLPSPALAAGPSASPEPTISAVKALAAALAEAPTDAEQKALLAKADPQWLDKNQLRDELAALQFQRAVEGDYVKAEAIARLLLHITTDSHDDDGVALSKVLLGGVLREFGEYTEAISLLQQALDYYRKNPGDSRGLVRAYQSTAIIYLLRSDFSRALANVHEALTLAQRIGYHDGIIPALNTTGEVFRTQGQPERALQFYERARKEVGDDGAWNMAYIFNNIGQAYEALGDTEKAVDFINRARAIAEKVKMRPRVATSLAVLGALYLVRHEVEKAKQSYEQSLALSIELKDRASEGRAELGLAKCARAEGNAATALERAAHAAQLYLAVGQRTEFAAAETEAGRALRTLGRDDEARAAFEKAISEIEQLRTQVAGGATESESFFSTQIAPFQELVSMFVASAKYPEALAMAERASARTLLDIVASGKPDVERSMNETERERARSLDRKIAELNRAVKQARSAPQRDETKISQVETELTSARDAHESFQARLLAVHPDWKRAVSSAEPASIEEIQHLVDTKTQALLKFVATDTETFLFVVRGGSSAPKLQVFKLKSSGEELARRIKEFREKLATRSLDWQEPAEKLYAILLKASEDSWKDAESIVIVPDGMLWELPFGALRTDGRCLIEKRTISYAPALSFLTRRTEKPSADSLPTTLMAVGNPALSAPSVDQAAPASDWPVEQWPPLPATEQQLAELSEIYGKNHSRLLLGEGARESEFKADAQHFDVLHFATHGVLNNRAPLYSYLLFAQTNLGPDEDGFLEARELMQMNLPARLAVLSACETARGGIHAGEGVIGLSWALFIAGCPTTVVSQWKVDSESNTVLMVDFHRRLHAGASPADALRDASLALAKNPEYRHPFYWAPFVVVGVNR